MKPVDLLCDLSFRLRLHERWCYPRAKNGKEKPGAFLLSLSESERKILASLKSEDLASIRPDLGVISGLSPQDCIKENRRQEFKQLKSEFEKKFK